MTALHPDRAPGLTAPRDRDVARTELGRELRRIRVEVLDLTGPRMADWLGLTTHDPRGRPTSTGKALVSRFEKGVRLPDEQVLEQYGKAGSVDATALRQLWRDASTDDRPVVTDAPVAVSSRTRSRRWVLTGGGALVVAAVVGGTVTWVLPHRDAPTASTVRQTPVAGVSFIFDALGPQSDQTIHVYAGYADGASDKQVTANYENGQSAAVICTTSGRTVVSHPEDGERAESSNGWVRILDANGRDSYASLTYGRITPTTAAVPRC